MNARLEYIGVLDNIVNQWNFDGLLLDADNGQQSDVSEAKPEIIERLECIIEDLQQSVYDIKTMSLKKLQNKYS